MQKRQPHGVQAYFKTQMHDLGSTKYELRFTIAGRYVLYVALCTYVLKKFRAALTHAVNMQQ